MEFDVLDILNNKKWHDFLSITSLSIKKLKNFTHYTWQGQVQTESTMKSDVFIENLGYAYQKDESGINSGYPILKWQYNFYGNK